MTEYPSLSIVIPTLNAENDLERCLTAIDSQDYPSDRIEVLVLDGGSTDATREVAEAHGCRVSVDNDPSHRGTRLGTGDARMALGVTLARNEIVAFIMSDNWMPDDHWLEQMVRPLADDQEIVGSFTLRYRYRPEGSLLERYFALFGVGDPVAFYLNKRDRISWAEDTLPYHGDIDDRGAYYHVRFAADGLPPIGCNGSLIRRELLLQSNMTPDRFGHSDTVQDLVDLGHNAFAVVKNDITHAYQGSMFNEIRKRLLYFRLFGEEGAPRRHRMVDWRRPADVRGVALYLLYALTFVKPTWDAACGFRRQCDVAWFLHPFFCFCMTFAYGYAVTLRAAHRVQRARSRQ